MTGHRGTQLFQFRVFKFGAVRAVRIYKATVQKTRQQTLLEIAAVLVVQLVIRARAVRQPFPQPRIQFFKDATDLSHQIIRNHCIKFGGEKRITNQLALIVMYFLLASLHVVVRKDIFTIRCNAVLEATMVGKHAQGQYLRNNALFWFAIQSPPEVLPTCEGMIDLAFICNRVNVIRIITPYAACRRKKISLKFIRILSEVMQQSDKTARQRQPRLSRKHFRQRRNIA